MSNAKLIVVTGLPLEARFIHDQPHLAVCLSYMSPVTLTKTLEALLERHCDPLIVSFGFAAGVSPQCKPGDIVLGEGVAFCHNGRPTSETIPCSLPGLTWIRAALKGTRRTLHQGVCLGVDTPVLNASDKFQLGQSTDARSLDMESHRVAQCAMQHKLDFLIVRVICDPVERTLDPHILEILRADGTLNPGALVRCLTKRSAMQSLGWALYDTMRAKGALKEISKIFNDYTHESLSAH